MSIAILTHDPRWKGLAPTVKRAAEAALCYLSSPRARTSSTKKKLDPRLRGDDKYSVAILLTDDAEVQQLNHQYRKKNKPTNVLSFPNGSVEGGVIQLGDIAMAYDTLAREAAAQGKPLKHHLTHLTIHGVLHLLGYDHEAESEAEAMESLEIAILGGMGIANPYESA